MNDTQTQQRQALRRSWESMIDRCHSDKPDPRCEGTAVFEPWRDDFKAFATWVDDNLGPRAEGHYLRRINARKDFEPGNLMWLDPRASRAAVDTTDEKPYPRTSRTADGRFRALIGLGTYETEGEALSVAESVLTFMKENYA